MCTPDVQIRANEEDTAVSISKILVLAYLRGGELRCYISR
jgi:hypothetical protein